MIYSKKFIKNHKKLLHLLDIFAKIKTQVIHVSHNDTFLNKVR